MTPTIKAFVDLLPELKREFETLHYKTDYLKQIRLQTIITAARELSAQMPDVVAKGFKDA